jgi:GntR family transcriptional regulator
MNLHISLTDGVPIYQQIVTQIRYLVAAGQLKPGVELPPIRALAEKLQVNPNTIARAYRELAREGTVEKRSTKGTFVAESVMRLTARHRQSAIRERIDQLLAEARQLGFTLEQLLKQVESRSNVMDRKQKRPQNKQPNVKSEKPS